MKIVDVKTLSERKVLVTVENQLGSKRVYQRRLKDGKFLCVGQVWSLLEWEHEQQERK